MTRFPHSDMVESDTCSSARPLRDRGTSLPNDGTPSTVATLPAGSCSGSLGGLDFRDTAVCADGGGVPPLPSLESPTESESESVPESAPESVPDPESSLYCGESALDDAPSSLAAPALSLGRHVADDATEPPSESNDRNSRRPGVSMMTWAAGLVYASLPRMSSR